MKRLLLVALAALAVALPANAHAAVPCRDRIYNEWYATGKISTSYPISCYHDALQHIPSDAQVYSNLGGDIKAALQAALRRLKHPSGVPAAIGHGPSLPPGTHGLKGAHTTKRDGLAAGTVAAPASSSPSGLPTPILVLGGVALALAAAGLAGTGWRYVRRRGSV
jgi:hypothetical protein